MLTMPELYGHEISLLHVVWKGMLYILFIVLGRDERVGPSQSYNIH